MTILEFITETIMQLDEKQIWDKSEVQILLLQIYEKEVNK